MSRKRIRSRASQLNFAISSNVKMNVSKKAENRNKNIENSATIYSVGRTEDLRATANNLCKFLDDKYPNANKLISKIAPEQVQEYLNFKSKTNNLNSMKEIISRLGKLDSIVQKTYGGGGFARGLEIPLLERADKIRDRAMSLEHIELLREEMKNSKSQAVKALEISVFCGLRSKEISRLHSCRIDIENRVLHIVEGAKNGRHRDVPIRDKHLSYFKNLKEETAGQYVCGGVKEESLNAALRRYMKQIEVEDNKTLSDIYPKSGIHAIRKHYANDRMQELRGNEPLENRDAEMKMWDIVSRELGHGENRHDLHKTYVG